MFRAIPGSIVLIVANLMTTEPLQAVVINFEDIAVPVGTNSIGGDRTSGGFFFNSLTNHTHLTNGSAGSPSFNLSDNGTTYLVADDFNGENPLTLSPVGGGPFSVQSVAFGEWDSLLDTASSINITGNQFGGGVLMTTVAMDLIFDGSGPVIDFQSEVFNSSWVNLQSVVFKGNGSGNGNDYFALDNIIVNSSVATIPEPSSATIWGLVLFLLTVIQADRSRIGRS